MSAVQPVAPDRRVALVLSAVALCAIALCWLPLAGFTLTMLLVGAVAWRMSVTRSLRIAVPVIAALASELGSLVHLALTEDGPLTGKVAGVSPAELVTATLLRLLIEVVILVAVSESARAMSTRLARADARLLGAVAVVVAASWWLWFGLDGDGYYEVWQGVGLGLTALIPGCLLVWRMRSELVALVLTPAVVGLAYGVSAAIDWSRTDDSGLFMIGVMMLIPGTAVAAFFACGLTRLLRDVLSRRALA